MARQPRPPKGYDQLAMARELKAASGGQDRTSADSPADRRGQVRTSADKDYRRTLFEGLFQ